MENHSNDKTKLAHATDELIAGRFCFHQRRVHTPSFRERSRDALSRARLDLWTWRAFLHSAACEFGTLGRRIGTLYRTRGHRHGVDFGPAGRNSSNGEIVSCAATFRRMRDMQCMLSNHPLATRFDQELYLEGWEMGARWVACTCGTLESRREKTAAQALADVMHDLDALQESSRELSARSATHSAPLPRHDLRQN
jgi:hypothetical protein